MRKTRDYRFENLNQAEFECLNGLQHMTAKSGEKLYEGISAKNGRKCEGDAFKNERKMCSSVTKRFKMDKCVRFVSWKDQTLPKNAGKIDLIEKKNSI